MSTRYDSSKFDEELNKRFSYHPPIDENQTGRYEEIRGYAKNFARILKQRCPDSREFFIAMTKIEEAVFWANAAIARNETEEA
jgi:hypothetical protein